MEHLLHVWRHRQIGAPSRDRDGQGCWESMIRFCGNIGPLDVYLIIPLGYLLFYILFLFLLRMDECHCPVFTFADPLFCFISLLLNPSTDLFSLVIVFFCSMISLWYLFKHSLFVEILTLRIISWPQWVYSWSLFWTPCQISHFILLQSFFEVLSWFIWNVFLVSYFFLTLCVGFCALDKRATCPIL